MSEENKGNIDVIILGHEATLRYKHVISTCFPVFLLCHTFLLIVLCKETCETCYLLICLFLDIDLHWINTKTFITMWVRRKTYKFLTLIYPDFKICEYIFFLEFKLLQCKFVIWKQVDRHILVHRKKRESMTSWEGGFTEKPGCK